MIKKVQLILSNGFITPFESDTVLSYIFAFVFLQQNKEVIKIFDDFKSGNIPFNITNGFFTYQEKVFVPRPIFFDKKNTKKQYKKNECNLKNDIENEKNRKKLKKLSFIYFEDIKDYFANPDEVKKKYIDVKFSNLVKLDQEVWKNTIPRFNFGETNPFSLSVNFSKKITIYVKIYDENKFEVFYDFMKNILLSLGYGAGKSRGFGKIKEINLEDINHKEKEVFTFLENLKKEGKYLILNNFKPLEEDLKNIDFERSYIDINFKHTKTLQELNENFFKGPMNFIKLGSYVVVKNKNKQLKGDFYKSGNSYNFGFIF